jgi:hypothetical protein
MPLINSRGTLSSVSFGQSSSKSSLYTFTSLTFTPGGATGRYGPTIDQIKTGLTVVGDSTWKNDLTLLNSNSGIILWTVPISGAYRIRAVGASTVYANWNQKYGYAGREPGQAASMQGDFNFTAGIILKLVVGQKGSSGSQSSSGGGGSFVYLDSNNLYLAAGGGGGCGLRANAQGGDASLSTSGTALTSSTSGGTAGGAGTTTTAYTYTGGAGAGWLASALNTSVQYGGSGGFSLSGNWAGGSGGYDINNEHGGFGGGGGAGAEGGGAGGGYSGGGAGIGCMSCVCGGGGGGSYNAGTNQVNALYTTRYGHGFIVINKL